jgi:hypothetical protein
MNKLYAALVGTIVAGSAMAQSRTLAPAKKYAQAPVHPIHQSTHAQRGAAIWSNDFSNPSDWQMGGDGANDWVIGQVAPSGSFPSPAIASTTADNGWAIYDSDLYCASSDDAWMQYTSPIDLTGFASVQLQFEELYRNFHSITWVDVSTDGLFWTPFQVNSNVATNASSANPETVTVPISSVAGNQGSVFIRFRFTSVAGCDYAWQVDDVSISAITGYDLLTTEANTTAYDYFTTTTWDSLPYSVYPISEIRPLALNMKYTSNSVAAENATATITTSDGFSATNTGSIEPSDTVHYYSAPYTPSASVGVYNINYTVSGDNPDLDTTNNSKSNSVEVSTGVFARDDNNLAYLLYDDTLGSAFKVGNGFHVNSDEMLYSIDAAFYTSSEVGSGLELNAQLLDANSANFDPLAESQYHTLVESELSAAGAGNFVRFYFNPPVQLTAGTDYLAVVQHFGGVVLDVGAGGTSAAQTSFIYQSSDATWYYTTRTPMVRMNFDAPTGVAAIAMQNGVGLGQNVPNPANNTSTVSYSLDHGAQVNLNLFDINGKLVRTLVNGNMAAGNHRVDINTADLQEGVYFYTLTTGKNTSTKRMTVVR